MMIYTRRELQHFESMGKPIVLLCFEDVRLDDPVWRRRKLFTEWWENKTGDIIPELEDGSPTKK